MFVIKHRVKGFCESNPRLSSDQISEQAHNRLAQDQTYAHFFQHVTCHYENGVLTLRGSVPTHRLRDLLVQLLSDLAEDDAIDNQVDVISSTGLSFIRSK